MLIADRFRVNTPQVVCETIDGEVVIINFDSGNYYSTDKTGCEIWDMIEKTTPVDEIVNNLSLRYLGDPANIKKSVNHMLAELCNEELIVPFEGEEIEASQTNGNVASARPAFETPVLQRYSDMQELLLLDPIHEVDESGWPSEK